MAEAAAPGPRTIMIRQEDIQLRPARDSAGLHGTVLTRIFLGSRVRYIVDLGGQTVRCLAPADRMFDAGEKVELSIPGERLTLLAD